MAKAGYSAERKDRGRLERGWAKSPNGVTGKLSAVAVSFQKPIHHQIRVPEGAAITVAVAICEGWHDEPGRRILDLNVEGDEAKHVDTIADLGKNKPGLFSFHAQDKNGDRLIDLKVSAAAKASDKNAILNGFWVFPAEEKPADAAVLSGESDSKALLVCYAGQSDADSRNDVVLVHVTNKSGTPQIIAPKVLVQSGLKIDFPEDRRIRVDSHETVCCTEKIASVKKRKVEMRRRSGDDACADHDRAGQDGLVSRRFIAAADASKARPPRWPGR